jgi:3-hydroxyethyl bacteriochlorophyllide a dehydrogenase
LDTLAVLLTEPQAVALRRVALAEPSEADVVVDVAWSGISTGTEKLLWSGRMPPFPGLGYPLVPGYESVGTVREAGPTSGRRVGEQVFIPGSRGFRDVRGLFGGAARRLVAPGARVTPVPAELGADAILLALAATAHHAIAGHLPSLIIGHGVLGRLLARLTVALGGAPPTVWESNPERAKGAMGYQVCAAEDDPRSDHPAICDASGDAALLDTLIARLAHGGEITLAGFYADRLSFAFPAAFMREARFRIAAEWRPSDMRAVTDMAADGRLDLTGLLTHREPAGQAEQAYRTAFEDSQCLKMVLDWRTTE